MSAFYILFSFLVCASHKKPKKLTDFDCLYIKNYFEPLNE